MWRSLQYKLYLPHRQNTGEGLCTSIGSGNKIFTAEVYESMNCRLYKAH